MKKTAKKAPKAVAVPARPKKPKAAPAAPGTPAPVLTQAATVTSATSKTSDRGEASKAFAVEVARQAVLDRCSDVRVLDVRGLSPVTDFLVLATGTSGRQMRSTADDVVKLGKGTGYAPLSSSGLEGETWICVDFVDVLFHMFNPESRGYYDLESLWGDAKPVEFKQEK